MNYYCKQHMYHICPAIHFSYSSWTHIFLHTHNQQRSIHLTNAFNKQSKFSLALYFSFSCILTIDGNRREQLYARELCVGKERKILYYWRKWQITTIKFYWRLFLMIIIVIVKEKQQRLATPLLPSGSDDDKEDYWKL